MTKQSIRPSVQANRFYPGNPDQLRKTLDNLFQEAGPVRPVGDLLGLLAPHAAYEYSGIVAARAYLSVDRSVKRFIILGPSHYTELAGAGLSQAEAWDTPLGSVPVDTTAVERLLQHPCFFASDALHEKEHSIEVHVPFIKYRFPEARILPVVVGQDWLQCADPLLELIDPETVVVMSSDLYHGASYQECVETDARTLDIIQRMNPDQLLIAAQAREIMMCGLMPAALGITLMNQLGARASIITYTNSAEATGNFSGYVVGYAAVAFVK